MFIYVRSPLPRISFDAENNFHAKSPIKLLLLLLHYTVVDKVMWTSVGRRHFMKLTTKLIKIIFLDDENEGASDDSDDKVGEVRFVPEDKSACKMQKN